MQTKYDKSFGVIPVRKVSNTWEVFLIHQYSRIGDNTYWTFPKGHPEEGESSVDTALRELEEETGINQVTLWGDKEFKSKYQFKYDGDLIKKTVTYYLAKVTQSDFKIDESEVREAGWYQLEEAKDRLDYQKTRSLFNEVVKYLDSQQ
jgi:8-oxo-dGTP pyrophosphatase MutT (NUDIX family)